MILLYHFFDCEPSRPAVLISRQPYEYLSGKAGGWWLAWTGS
jgi:hypothetical protein